MKLYDLLREVRSVPTDRFRFQTIPRAADPAHPNRDVLRQPAANDLFKRLRQDRPLDDAPADGETAPGPETPPDDHAAPDRESPSATCE